MAERAETVFSDCGTEWTTCRWMVVLIVSVTVNLFVVVYLCTGCVLRVIRRRTRYLYTDDIANGDANKRKLVPTADELIVKLTTRYRKETSTLFTESLFTFILFGASFYLLIDGAVENGFTTKAGTERRFVTTSTACFSVAIGHLVASLCADIRRLRSVDKPEVTLHHARQFMERALMLFVFVIMTSSTDAVLTRTLLCIMPVDLTVVSLGLLLDRCGLPKSATLVAFSAFLSLAFRGILPLVSILVSVTRFRQAALDMATGSIAVVVGTAIVYACHNTYVIVTSLIDVCRACSAGHATDLPGAGHFRPNNELAVDRKSAPAIDLVFNKLDLGDIALQNRTSEKCRLPIHKTVLARLSTANRMWFPEGSTGSAVGADKIKIQNECRRFTKRNSNYLMTNTRKQNSQAEKYLTLLETIEEETASVKST